LAPGFVRLATATLPAVLQQRICTMKRVSWLVMAAAGLAAPGLAVAAVDCGSLPSAGAQAQRVTVLAPLALELTAPSYMLGANSGVLGNAYDESQTVDEVLLRRRIEGCRYVAIAPPVGVGDPTHTAGSQSSVGQD